MKCHTLWIVSLLLMPFCSCSSKQEPIDFEFQGIRIGDTVDQAFLDKFFEDDVFKNQTNDGLGKETYSKTIEFPTALEYYTVSITVIGSRVEEITIDYKDLDQSPLRIAIEEKYGKAHSVEKDHNGDYVYEWTTKSGKLEINKRNASIHSDKYMKWLDQRTKKQKKEMADNI